MTYTPENSPENLNVFSQSEKIQLLLSGLNDEAGLREPQRVSEPHLRTTVIEASHASIIPSFSAQMMMPLQHYTHLCRILRHVKYSLGHVFSLAACTCIFLVFQSYQCVLNCNWHFRVINWPLVRFTCAEYFQGVRTLLVVQIMLVEKPNMFDSNTD